MIEIYTDGSSTKKRSGWGFVALVDGAKVYEKAGTEHQGDTNQKMEIIAVIEACDWAINSEYIKNHNVIVYSDSAYVINCFKDKWFVNWEQNGWKNSKKEPVANSLEWKFLIKFFKMSNFTFEKVKGHAGHIHNERADDLAQGKTTPDKDSYFNNNKEQDSLYIEVSNIFLNYAMKRISIKEAVMNVVNLVNKERIGNNNNE